jgi:hypothetical protein
LVDEAVDSKLICELAKRSFGSVDANCAVLSRPLLESESGEITLERYQEEQAWGLSTHIDLASVEELNKFRIAELIHDLLPPLISATPYKLPHFELFDDSFVFAQLIDTSAIYGLVRGKEVFLDVFSCKHYSSKALNRYVADNLKAERFASKYLLRK